MNESLHEGPTKEVFQVLAFTAPGDPVPKGRPRFARGGKFVRTFTPAATLRYEERIAAYARDQVDAAPAGFPLDCPVRAELVCVFRRHASRKQAAHMDRKPDLDNVVKAILDGLANGGAIKTDSRVVEIQARKEYGDLPETRVKLFTLDIKP